MIAFQFNKQEFERGLTDVMRRQLPYATSRALNDTAEEAMDAMRVHMRQRFDAPTRWTLNAFMVRRSTKTHLTATIELKPTVKGRHYLKVEAKGGPRPMTGRERQLDRRLKYAGIIRTVTPGRAIRLNRSGNITRGKWNQIMSAVQAQGDATANATTASRKRNRRRAQYFVPRPGSSLSPGVWTRTSKRGSVRKVLNFSDKVAVYRKRVDFGKVVAHQARTRFPKHLEARLRQALATAR